MLTLRRLIVATAMITLTTVGSTPVWAGSVNIDPDGAEVHYDDNGEERSDEDGGNGGQGSGKTYDQLLEEFLDGGGACNGNINLGAPNSDIICSVNPGNPAGPGLFNAWALAESGLTELNLAKAEVHTAPKPPNLTYVTLDTWLWIPEQQWTPITTSVSAGPVTVTLTATPKAVAWDMGPGSTTCESPGKEWKFGAMSKSAETDCSYVYREVSTNEADGTFKVTAQIIYTVDWTCEGPLCSTGGGTFGDVPGPAGNAALRVGERQSVIVR